MKHRFVSLIMALVTLLALIFSSLGVTTASAATNIAQGKTVNCSSIEWEAFYCLYAVDGDMETRWSSILSPSGPEWIYVDLAGVYDITQVILNWENARATTYEIQVSADASSWTTIYSTTTGSGDQDVLNVTGAGRYIRMFGIEHNDPFWGYSIWEFEVYGTPARAVTQAATAVSLTGATLNGTVINLLDNSMTVSFDYGLDTDYGTTVTAAQSPVTGIGVFDVSKVLTGLTPLTTYHYRIVATSDEGTFYGLDRTFYTVDPPTVTTDAATLITSSGATLNGTVNANNGTSTVTFEYGLDTDYGTTVTADQSQVSGTTSTPVSKFISGLMNNTTYHYRTVAVNGGGITYGNDNSFTTTTCSQIMTVASVSDNGPGTLRQAIADLCADGIIMFDDTLSGQTIHLESTLVISKNMTIDGTGLSPQIVLSGDTTGDGSGDVRVMHIHPASNVTLDRLTITKGYTFDNGGGIYNEGGVLTLTNSNITANQAGSGSGIENAGGTLNVLNTLFTNNTDAANGGAINNDGPLTIDNSTFLNNTAIYGGAIHDEPFSGIAYTVNITNSTFVNNSGGIDIYNIEGGSLRITNSTFVNNGSGIELHQGTATVINTIIADSTTGTNCSGVFEVESTNNLSNNDTCGGSFDVSSSILYGTLGEYGGFTPTIPLMTGSSAIDSGDAAACTNAPVNDLDQRGYARDASCDIGAFEYNGLPTPPEISIYQSSTAIMNGGNHDIGGQILNLGREIIFTIKNTGTADLTITTPISIAGTDEDQFSMIEQPSTVPGSDSAIFIVEFLPTTPGAKTATISISSNDSDENPYSFDILGRGIEVPVLTWADPAAIDQGTPLSDTQLNATANVPGAFTYTPASGTYLSTGTHTLHVDFVPTDTANYANASQDVSITVNDHVIFNDVPDDYWARPFIEKLYLNQITGGCGASPLTYCPAKNVTRAQMAVFVLRAVHGSTFAPLDATGTVFTDVPADGFAADWIEQMAAEGITGGCGGGKFCPNAPVTRAQMAVFLVKAMYGTDYTPPAATGEIFTDVPADGFAAAFIEQLVADGITGGCGGGNFCPNKYITRAEMAVFLVAAFDLP